MINESFFGLEKYEQSAFTDNYFESWETFKSS